MEISNSDVNPKKDNAQEAGEHRPITVLPTMQNILLRSWMREAAPYLVVRHPTSHIFRAGQLNNK